MDERLFLKLSIVEMVKGKTSDRRRTSETIGEEEEKKFDKRPVTAK